ncbi:MAG: hypothetical protein M1457_11300 [bacterium]|nr:hypothetical protein [bacterium]
MLSELRRSPVAGDYGHGCRTGREDKGLRFDGISIAPALDGQPLNREMLFCHFPHNQWIQNGEEAKGPATRVRRGDWKTIRFYRDADEGGNYHELYNLGDDIGETRNLAGENSEMVRELDALIDGHLKNTGGLLPRRNPAYDPNVKAPTPAGRKTKGTKAKS